MPARTASSTTNWIAGLSTTGSISFDCALVAGRKRVPRPAAGMTALWTVAIGLLSSSASALRPRSRRPMLSRGGRRRGRRWPPTPPTSPPGRPGDRGADRHRGDGEQRRQRRLARRARRGRPTPRPRPRATQREGDERRRPPPSPRPCRPGRQRRTGKQWPSTAAAAAGEAARPVPAARSPTPAATTPLATSPASTTRPARRPMSRYTLVAPGLPEPSVLGSWPRRPPTSPAVGNEPRR